MNTSCAFNVNDIAIGSSKVMISIERRRFLIKNLSNSDIQALIKAHKGKLLYLNSISPNLLSALTKIGLVFDRTQSNESAQPPARLSHQIVIPSRFVKPICSALTLLSTTPGLLALLFLSILGMASGTCRPLYPTNITAWLSTTSGLNILITSVIFLGFIFFHELGHGAACLNRTGLVGCITGRLYMGIPILTTDVSSLHCASSQDKAVVAISGVVFQTSMSVAFLMLPSEIARTGATLSLMSAAFALLPLPGSDGYWLLSDFFQTRIAGYFGSKGRKDWIGIAYTCLLLSVTPFLVYKLTSIGLTLFNNLANHFTYRTIDLIDASVGIYVFVVAILFTTRVIKFLKDGQPEIDHNKE